MARSCITMGSICIMSHLVILVASRPLVIYPWRIRMYGRLMLTWRGSIDGKWQTMIMAYIRIRHGFVSYSLSGFFWNVDDWPLFRFPIKQHVLPCSAIGPTLVRRRWWLFVKSPCFMSSTMNDSSLIQQYQITISHHFQRDFHGKSPCLTVFPHMVS